MLKISCSILMTKNNHPAGWLLLLLRNRDFFGVLPSAFAELRSLSTGCPNVHRKFWLGFDDRPCSNPFSTVNRGIGIFRQTAVCLRGAALLAHVGKNSPPDCFLPQASLAPSLFESLFDFTANKNSHPLDGCFYLAAE